VCISASHTHEDLEYALEVIGDVCDVSMMKYGLHHPLAEPCLHPTFPEKVPPRGVTADDLDMSVTCGGSYAKAIALKAAGKGHHTQNGYSDLSNGSANQKDGDQQGQHADEASSGQQSAQRGGRGKGAAMTSPSTASSPALKVQSKGRQVGGVAGSGRSLATAVKS